MSRWFRLYEELLDDPKVQRLPAEDFKAYINLLCLASRHDGVLPTVDAISFALRLPDNGALTVVSRLKDAGLVVARNGGAHGSHNAINGWNKRQFKSDTSTERVKRFRGRSKNGSETAAETPPDSETEREKERADARGNSGDGKKATKPKARFEFTGEETIMRAVREKFADALDHGEYARLFCDPKREITFESEEGRLVAYCADGFTHSLVRDHEFKLAKIAQQHGFSTAWIREKPEGESP